MNKAPAIKEFKRMPGVGNAVAQDLWEMGYRCIADLKNEDPELMYLRHNEQRGQVQDVCMLYTFRCAVYFANTQHQQQDPEKLNWWYWTDEVKMSSKAKDAALRKKLQFGKDS